MRVDEGETRLHGIDKVSRVLCDEPSVLPTACTAQAMTAKCGGEDHGTTGCAPTTHLERTRSDRRLAWRAMLAGPHLFFLSASVFRSG